MAAGGRRGAPQGCRVCVRVAGGLREAVVCNGHRCGGGRSGSLFRRRRWFLVPNTDEHTLKLLLVTDEAGLLRTPGSSPTRVRRFPAQGFAAGKYASANGKT
jgi:hypothetical protein